MVTSRRTRRARAAPDRAQHGGDAGDGDGLGLGQVVSLGVVGPHDVDDLERQEVGLAIFAPFDPEPHYRARSEVDGRGVLRRAGEHHAPVCARRLGREVTASAPQASLPPGGAVVLAAARGAELGVGRHGRAASILVGLWAVSSSSRRTSSSAVDAGARHTERRHT